VGYPLKKVNEHHLIFTVNSSLRTGCPSMLAITVFVPGVSSLKFISKATWKRWS
jgi:hypothetical protein